MKKAILFLTFNRLDTTERVFEEIRKAQPPRLYLASDGAREDKEGEKEIVQKTRDFILNNIDWDCAVKTLFRDKNLGCGRAVSEAITWFFSQEDDGIVLEDDCLPNESFFWYCEELLDYHKYNKKIMHIAGTQIIPDYKSEYSYYFAKIQHCWGWASWADRWNEYYDYNLKNFSERDAVKFSDSKRVQIFWSDILKKMKNHEIDTWDYQWVFSIVGNDGLCINPSKNLVSNIGFGSGTHTLDKNDPCANLKSFNSSEMIHPSEIKFDKFAVNRIYDFFVPKKEESSHLKNSILVNKIKFIIFSPRKFILKYFKII